MPRTIKLCPKCGSRDISVDSGWLVGLGVPARYVCDDCNFSSVMFPEVAVGDVRKAQAGKRFVKNKDHHYVDASYGDFLVGGSRLWWRFVGALNMAISGLIIYSHLSGASGDGSLYFGSIFLAMSALTFAVAHMLPGKMSINQKRMVGALIILELVVFGSYFTYGYGIAPVRFPGV